MIVSEIFNSIEGEGKRQGQMATFIRLFGCNLSCRWCDTIIRGEGLGARGENCLCERQRSNRPQKKNPSPLTPNPSSLETIVAKINHKRVTLTGGEPLIHKGADKLIKALVLEGCEVNIETNGSVDISPFKQKGVFFSIDYKLNSSGESEKMYMPNFYSLRKNDVLKFVVGDFSDIAQMVSIAKQVNTPAQIYITLTDTKFAQSVFEAMSLEKALEDTRLSVQLHKILNFR